MNAAGYARCGAEASRKFYKNAFESPHVSCFLAAFHQSLNKPTRLNMKNFVSLRIAILVLVTGYVLSSTADDNVVIHHSGIAPFKLAIGLNH
jgi:hypothetical protein